MTLLRLRLFAFCFFASLLLALSPLQRLSAQNGSATSAQPVQNSPKTHEISSTVIAPAAHNGTPIVHITHAFASPANSPQDLNS